MSQREADEFANLLVISDVEWAILKLRAFFSFHNYFGGTNFNVFVEAPLIDPVVAFCLFR